MHSSQVLTALAALACLNVALAAPQVGRASGTTVRSVNFSRNGPQAFNKALRKYAGARTLGSSTSKRTADAEPLESRQLYANLRAAAPLGGGSVQAVPDQKVPEYLSPVSIGTPPQVLQISFDTGSADFWLYTEQLISEDWEGHTSWAPAKSSTAKLQNGLSWRIGYADGSGASGNVYVDTVTIGAITAHSLAIEAATEVSDQFEQDEHLDGVLGLGPKIANQVTPQQQDNFYDTVSGALVSKLFAAYMRDDGSGAFDFGYLNPYHYTGDIHYAPADLTSGYWQITTTGYKVGGASYGTTLTSVVDTGTTLIIVTDEVVNNYYGAMQSAYSDEGFGGWIFKCSETPPDFAITVGGSQRVVPGKLINWTFSGYKGDVEYCYGGIQSTPGLEIQILGDVFLQSQYAVFDPVNSRVGFADQLV